MAQWNKNTQDYLNQERTLHEVFMCADRYGNIGDCGVSTGISAGGYDAFGRSRTSEPFTLADVICIVAIVVAAAARGAGCRFTHRFLLEILLVHRRGEHSQVPRASDERKGGELGRPRHPLQNQMRKGPVLQILVLVASGEDVG